MSVKLSAYVWDGCAAAGMKITSVAIMARLADFSSDEGLCWPSIATIARQIGAGPSTVRTSLRKLESDGWLTTTARRKGNRNNSNMYQLNVKKLREAAALHMSESDTSKSDASKSGASVSDPSKSGATESGKNTGFHPPESGDDPSVTSSTDPSIKKTDGQLAPPADEPPPKINHQAVIEAYHKILPEMPKVLELTDGRRDKLRALWRKFNFTQDRWNAYLNYISEHCRWMCETRADNKSGRTWRKKNFDYLITERCYLAVKEERATDHPKATGQRDVNQTASVDYAHPDGWRGA
ncbi:helix-turn-helix domain-containing protein [Pantoea sp.]|uniref:helix-turn-helix domain-containing protein n=1 Tax=Pantoea sp. TaxID=69393 RepID=UPI0028AD8D00|nr:helix-turn-helix domain-containing protein [Pantoea sp.]